MGAAHERGTGFTIIHHSRGLRLKDKSRENPHSLGVGGKHAPHAYATLEHVVGVDVDGERDALARGQRTGALVEKGPKLGIHGRLHDDVAAIAILDLGAHALGGAKNLPLALHAFDARADLGGKRARPLAHGVLGKSRKREVRE